MYTHNYYCTTHCAFIDVFSDEFKAVGGYHVVRPAGTADWLLTYTTSGSGVFRHENGRQTASALEAILVKPGTPHDYRVADGAKVWRFCWAHFHAREHWLNWLNWPEAAPGILRLGVRDPAQHRRLVRLFRQVVKSAQRATRSSLNIAMNRLEEMLLVFDDINQKPIPDQRIARAMTFIVANLGDPLSLATIAEAAGLSESRFWHLFRDHVGQTPQSFIEFQRLSRAKLLLERSDQPVAQIAREVGLPDSFYFARRFRLNTGYSPLSFRRHIRAHPARSDSDAATV